MLLPPNVYPSILSVSFFPTKTGGRFLINLHEIELLFVISNPSSSLSSPLSPSLAPSLEAAVLLVNNLLVLTNILSSEQ